MLAHEAAALAAIRTVYARSVIYTGAGLDQVAVMAVKSDTDGSAYQGIDGRSRQVNFEIASASFTALPDNGNIIVDGDGLRWRVIDTSLRREVAAWVLFVEEAPTV